ncbi:hypothetical protein MMAD_23550 [Mycolicibacterium madagascariense]|uniref:Uncharacterized protein n=1 Tax=Mycolicibacterium madagascariense TaxID=212765 RepID=A0A7I7XFS7_9MYCO|nr:hypothetical protein MMAD_23550 [Mycolicibacterium madagascariense]
MAGFAPWIVYWVLDGNLPSAVAAMVALVLAAGALLADRVTGTPVQAIQIGSAATFVAVTIMGTLGGGTVATAWGPVVSYGGLLATTLFCAVTGTPMVRAFAVVGPPTDPSRSEEFATMRVLATRIWAVAAAVMTVASAATAIAPWRGVPATVGTWGIPVLAFGVAAVASRILSERAISAAANPGVVRRTSFVAFRELAIDELYYLAREKVEREVGAGMEAYDVNLGSAGTPLTGDESRESWAATYKVRERR